MTIQNFKKRYYDPVLLRQLEKEALWNFVIEYCEEPKRNAVAIVNGLAANGINSIDDLHNADIAELKPHRHLGKKRMEIVTKLKCVLNTSLG